MIQVQTDTARSLLLLTFTKHVSTRRQGIAVRTSKRHWRNCTGLLDSDGLLRLGRDGLCLRRGHSQRHDGPGRKVSRKSSESFPDPRKDIGFKVMSLFHYGHDVPIVTCETLDEAQKKLDL